MHSKASLQSQPRDSEILQLSSQPAVVLQAELRSLEEAAEESDGSIDAHPFFDGLKSAPKEEVCSMCIYQPPAVKMVAFLDEHGIRQTIIDRRLLFTLSALLGDAGMGCGDGPLHIHHH